METLTSPSIYDGLHSLYCLKQELQQIQNGKLTSKQGNKFAKIEKELKDFEWLKSKFSIEWFDKLSTDDKLRVMEIMGVKYEYKR